MGTALQRDCLILRLIVSPGWRTYRGENKRPAPFKAIEQMPKRLDLWDRWEEIYLDVDHEDYERRAMRFWRQNKREMSRGAKLLWPGRETLLSLMTERANKGHAAFDAEKQGNPIDPSTCEWPEEWFTHDTFWFDEWPVEKLAIRGIFTDPSKGKDAKRSDYSAIADIGITTKGHVYVDCDLERRPTDAFVARALEWYRRADAATLGIEINQFQELLVEDLEREADALGIDLDVTQINNTVNKNVRLRRLTPLLSKRRIHFKRKSRGAALCVRMTQDFPNGDFDDGPDAVEMGCRTLFRMLRQNQESIESNEQIEIVQ